MKPLSNPKHPQQLGKFGESLACSFLRNKGYTIIARNFKARYGEIDIIANHHDTLVFVEVKTRVGDTFGKPEEAITTRKLREIRATSEYYCLAHPHKGPMRIDLIAIALDADKSIKYIEHIENISG